MEIDLEQLADAPYREQAVEDTHRSESQHDEKKSDDGKQSHKGTDRHPSRDRSERGERGGERDGAASRESHRSHSRRDRSRSRHERHKSSRDYDRRDRDRERDRDRDHDYRRDDRHRERRDDDDRRRDDRDRKRSRSPRKERQEGETNSAVAEVDRAQPPRGDRRTPPITEEERDQRTVFVQQLAARLRTKELLKFFEKAGPVRDAQIVKDKISGRSKGVGYVEFKSSESIPAALQMTGQKLLGIPVIAQLTEAEKNRQAREEALAQGKLPGRPGDVPFHRLYVGNIHFNVGEEDLQAVFEPFGDLEFVSLQKDPETGRSRGYGFVQFKDTAHAREALEKMNGFDLGGRPIRVGLGNDKFLPDGTQGIQGRFSSKDFERDNGPPVRRGERRENGDRDVSPSGRRTRRVRELDDTEQGGVSFQNISRSDLMRKLARAEDALPDIPPAPQQAQPKKPQFSRGVLLKNMFDVSEETEPNWTKELASDVTEECNEKYGRVVHCFVDENSLGEIYVKFATLEGGKAAIEGLNGRWFGGKTIGAVSLLDGVYNAKFPEAKDL